MSARHTLIIYPAADIRRDLSTIRPVETRRFAELEAAIDAARALYDASQDPFIAEVHADPDAASLEDYIRAENVAGAWLEANPKPGCMTGTLADADYFRETYGITTARELDDHLFWASWSDAYKSACGHRPSHRPETRAAAEHILEAAWAAA